LRANSSSVDDGRAPGGQQAGIAWAAISGPEGSGRSSLLALSLRAYEDRWLQRAPESRLTIGHFSAVSLPLLEQEWRRFAAQELHIPHALYLEASELRAQVTSALRHRPGWLLAFDDVNWNSATEGDGETQSTSACHDFAEFARKFLPADGDRPALFQPAQQGCILTSGDKPPAPAVPLQWHAPLGQRPLPIALLTAIAFEQPSSPLRLSVAQQHELAAALPNPLALQLLHHAGFRNLAQIQSALQPWLHSTASTVQLSPPGSSLVSDLCSRVRSALRQDSRTLLDTLVCLDTQQLQMPLVRDLFERQLGWRASKFNAALEELLQRQLLAPRIDRDAYTMRPTLQRHFVELLSTARLAELLPPVLRFIQARVKTSEAQRQDTAFLSHVTHVLRVALAAPPSDVAATAAAAAAAAGTGAAACVVPLSPKLVVSLAHCLDAWANAETTRTNTHYVAEPMLRVAKEVVEKAAGIPTQQSHIEPDTVSSGRVATLTDTQLVKSLAAVDPLLPLWYCRLFYSIGRLNFYRCDPSLQPAANSDLRRAISLADAIGAVLGEQHRPLERLLAQRMGLCFIESLTMRQPDGLPRQTDVEAQMRTLRALVSSAEGTPYVNTTEPESSAARLVTPHTDTRFRTEVGRQLILHHIDLLQRERRARRSHAAAWSDLATFAPTFVSSACELKDHRDTVALARLLLLGSVSGTVPDSVLACLPKKGSPGASHPPSDWSKSALVAEWLLNRLLQQPAGSSPKLVQSRSNAHLHLAELHQRQGMEPLRVLAHLECCSHLQQSMPDTHPDVRRRKEIEDEWAWRQENRKREELILPW